MEFKNSNWKPSDSVQVNLKITHFNEKMKQRQTKVKPPIIMTWGKACGEALKYFENLYATD